MKKIYLTIPVILVLLSFFSCKDNIVTVPPEIIILNGPDTTILYTDYNGNILGGDLNDWCTDCHDSTNSCTQLYPPYPNPSSTSFKINLKIQTEDFVKLYFLNNSDTTFLIKDTLPVGSFVIDVSTFNFNLHNTYRKIFMKTLNFNCSGDIKFN